MKARRRRIRVPQILQLEASECGAASLAMVLAYFGKWISLDDARVQCGVSRDGSKASNILTAARGHGMVAKGYRKEVDGLDALPLPLIVHWYFSHFLVLEGVIGDRYYLADPAVGSRVVTAEEFDEGYTGVVLSLQPGGDFVAGGSRPQPLRAILSRLEGSRGALALVAILAVVLVLPALAVPAFAKAFIDGVLVTDQDQWLRPLILGLLFVAALRAVVVVAQQRLLAKIQLRLVTAGAARIIWQILRLPIPFFNERHAGEIASRVIANDRLAAVLSGDLTQAALDLVTTVVLGLVMLSYDPKLGAVALLALAPNLLLLAAVGERQRRASQRQGAYEAKLHAVTVGAVETVETLKASGLEGYAFARWAGHQAKLLAVRRELEMTEGWVSTLPLMFRVLATVVLLGMGSLRVLDGALSIGSLVSFLALADTVAEPVARFVGLTARLREAEVDVSRIDDALGKALDPQVEQLPVAGAIAAIRGEVTIRDVSFGYSRLEPPLIENFSLHLKPGMRVALVGGSGSGKSTIARLLSGQYPPWSGEILLDGHPLSTIPAAMRARSVASIDQDVFLFEGSIRDNLTLWDASVTDRRLLAALTDAALLDEVLSRPGRLDGLVAEGGANFSGGQRQRLEIARALVGDPVLLLLDEATAALDVATEKLIDDRLRARGATCLIIAHRLSTIRDADEIIVMRRGQIVERGRHGPLLDRGGEYAELVASL